MLRTLALCLFLTATPVLAQTDEDKSALDAMLTEMSEAMTSGNILATMEMLPPAMMEDMAKNAGLNKDQLLEATRAQVKAAGDTMTFTEITLGGDNIEWKKSESGKDYALVPSESVVEVKDPASGTVMKMKQTATYVAFSDDGKWYMVDVSNPQQQAMFASAYPDYAEITVPEGTMEMVQ